MQRSFLLAIQFQSTWLTALKKDLILLIKFTFSKYKQKQRHCTKYGAFH